MKRVLIIAALILIVTGVAAPFLPLDFLKPGIAHVMELGIGRPVEIDSVYLTLFSGPGFSLTGVTIHEDPRVGIEPFAYAETLDARVDVWGLLRGRRGFSALSFNDAAINLAKRGDGPWNVQLLLESKKDAGDLPSIRMRGGRVNLKFDDVKSTLFFSDADLDVSRDETGRTEVRFSGVPSLTERSGQNFGHFFIRGSAVPSHDGTVLDLTAEMEPGSLDDIARLFGQSSLSWQGTVTAQARLSGPPSRLSVAGDFRLNDARRAQWLKADFEGFVDFSTQTVKIGTVPAEPVSLRIAASNFLTAPRWEVAADLHECPLPEALGAARKLGVPVPEGFAAEGALSGGITYQSNTGSGQWSGALELHDLAIPLKDGRTANAGMVGITLSDRSISFRPVVLTTGPGESAQIEGTLPLMPKASGQQPDGRTESPAGSGERLIGGIELKISTRGLRAADLGLLGVNIPLLDAVSSGTLRGTMRFVLGTWTGEYELRNSRLTMDGLAEPLHVTAALVNAKRDRVTVTRLRGSAGKISFSGDYQYYYSGTTPDRFRLLLEEVDALELGRIFRPTLVRGGGFIERTLRLGNDSPPPEWLTRRHASGTLGVKVLRAGGQELSVEYARVAWNGVSVVFSGIDANWGEAAVAGQLRVGLAGHNPSYRFQGRLGGIPYKGGLVDFEGNAEASGVDAGLWTSLRVTGTFRGKSISFAPGVEFRSASGEFSLSTSGAAPKWKLTNLELVQDGETYAGEGSSQADGKLVLDVTGKARPVRYIGSLLSEP